MSTGMLPPGVVAGVSMTEWALQVLDRGEVPTFRTYRHDPSDPTPIYDDTMIFLAAQHIGRHRRLRSVPYASSPHPATLPPGVWQQDTIGQAVGSDLPLPKPPPVVRLPIPARPLSYMARARTSDPHTSHAAAASVRNMTQTHERLLSLIKTGGDTTDEELYRRWQQVREDLDAGWPPISTSGLRTRRKELVEMGLVVDSGRRGRTATGRACVIWRLA